MLLMDGSAAVKICNGSDNFENSGIGTSGETEPVGDQFQHAVAGGVELAVFSPCSSIENLVGTFPLLDQCCRLRNS